MDLAVQKGKLMWTDNGFVSLKSNFGFLNLAQRLLRDTIDKRHAEYEALIKIGNWAETIPKMYVSNAKIIPPTGETLTGHPGLT